MMKQRLVLLMVMVLLCSLTACADKTERPTDTEQSTDTTTTATTATTTTTTTEATTTTTATATQSSASTIDYTVFCGRYSDTDTVDGPCYTVSINSVDNETKAIELSISFVGVNSSPVYTTEPIYASIADDHTVSFEWKDSWKNQGNGRLVLNPDDSSTVQLMMTVTEEAEVNRATLSTHDQYKTLIRRQE